jgi:hypothetical protein
MPRRNTGGFLSTKEQATDANSANGVFTTQEAAGLTAAGNFPTGRWTPQRSLRIRSANTSYLTRYQPSAGSRTTWTYSCWMKRGILGNTFALLSAGLSTSTASTYIGFASDYFYFANYISSSTAGYIYTNSPDQFFRDPSAWYHVVVAWDTTNANAGSRLQVWINGVKITQGTMPAQNTVSAINNAVQHTIGVDTNGNSQYFDGYISEINFVDGQALTPSAFGQTDPETGTWVPKRYSGTYGTNGYYLPFTDNSQISTILSNTATVTAPNGGIAERARSGDGSYVTSNTSGGSSFGLVQYDFGSITQITSIVIGAWYFTNNASSGGQVQISDDGTNWTAIASVTLNSASGTNFSFLTPYSCRYIRLAHTSFGTVGQGAVDSFVVYTNSIVWDQSGKTNPSPWADVNIAYATPTSPLYDWSVDVPGIATVSSQADVGGVTRGNYCTFNANDNYGQTWTVGQGGTRVYNGNYGPYAYSLRGTMAVNTGKWYYEAYCNDTGSGNDGGMGIFNTDTRIGYANANTISPNVWYYRYNGYIYANTDGTPSTQSAVQTPGLTATNTDVIGVALDCDAQTVAFFKNGYQIAPAFNYSQYIPAGAFISPGARGYYYSDWSFNFGTRPFYTTPPAGYKTWCTTNLPTPVIKRSNDHFDAKTWTGNGTSLSVGTTPKQTSTYAINRSLRFREAASAYLIKTPNTTSNQKTFTISAWVKLAKTSSAKNYIYTSGNTGAISTNYVIFEMQSSGFNYSTNYINFTAVSSNSTVCSIASSRPFEDTTQWQHVMVAVDTTQTIPSNRIKLYQNGKQITDLRASTFPSLNADIPFINNSSYQQYIGQIYSYGSFDGYMAEYNFIDGQQKAPSDFGLFDANNNWVPQRYTGTYGTNGFYLPMDTTASGFSGYYGEFNLTPTTQYLSIANSAAVQYGTGDFTQECFFQLNSYPASDYYCIFGAYSSTGHYVLIGTDGKLNWGTGGAINSTTLFAVSRHQWHHLAVVRASSYVTVYLNGRLIANSSALSGNLDPGAEFRIGSLSSGYPRIFNGLISNFRFVKGTALYTSDFTPPTSTLTAVTNTSALLLTGSSPTTDGSTNNLTVTNNGTVVVKSGNVGAYVKAFNDASGNNQHWTPVAVNVQPSFTKFITPGTTTWTAPPGVTSVNYLVVAGGGGGGQSIGGGGGAGGLLQGRLDVTPGTSYTVTVGSGGAGGSTAGAAGANGGNSVFSSITAIGGGGGGGNTNNQTSGGSGGGSGELAAVASGTAGQGYAGGAAYDAGSYYGSGGGGGAGGVGANGTSAGGGAGGAGLLSYITGASQYYAGGGGGGYYPTGGNQAAGGSNVGGSSGAASTPNGRDGAPFTGSGGGGAANTSSAGNGGSGSGGIVILSYAAGNDSLYDTPTDSLVDVNNDKGGSGNYATWGRDSGAGGVRTLSNANLDITIYYSSTYPRHRSNIEMTSGKWYAEFTLTSEAAGGGRLLFGVSAVTPASASGSFGYFSNEYAYYTGGNLYTNGINPATGLTTASTGDIVQLAYDRDLGKLWVGVNGTWLNSGNPSAGTNPSFGNIPTDPAAAINYFAIGSASSTSAAATANFGQQNFAFTPPTGFKALNSKNLKDVGSYNLPDSFGNFINTPDLVIVKGRSQAYEYEWFDSVRGPANYLSSNSTAANSNNWGTLTSFKPNGYDLSSGGYNNAVNETYVGWSWNRGKTPGFDVVTYAGSGSTVSQVISHNLGVKPKFMIAKVLNTTNGWIVYHGSLGATQSGILNGVNAFTSQTDWNNTEPTSNTFSVYGANNNVSGNSYVAYLWAEVPGFSKFGTYISNNTSDGPFIQCGFKPKFVMVKSSSFTNSETNWVVWDSARTTYNGAGAQLFLNRAYVEGQRDDNASATAEPIDFLSNGFKLRSSFWSNNGGSGNTFIYAAFAETPAKYATAR